MRQGLEFGREAILPLKRRQEFALPFVDVVLGNADEKLTALADGAGVKGSDIAACAAQPDTKTRVDASLALGKSVEVTGTPTLFINGRKIGNISQVPADTLKGLVDFASKPGQGTAAPTLKR